MRRRDFLKDTLAFSGSTLLFSTTCLTYSSAFAQTRGKSNPYPSYLSLEKTGELGKRREKLYSYYENCTLCPRDCRVDRTKGETGKCKSTSTVKVSSATPHFGEEAPLVGKGGSGTIFFSNCGLRCVYCQNYQISINGEGVEIQDEKLAELMVKLQQMGCHNINLVTPTHYVPTIVSALQHAIKLGLRIPLVYNTGGYEKLEVLQLLDGIIDVYLPDCKYMDAEYAAQYSDGVFNYPYYMKIALKEMHRQVGELLVNERGVATRGLIIRHLVLPNGISGTEKFVKFVAENLSRNSYVNIMRQYRPEHKAFEYPMIARRITSTEYEEAMKQARKSGLTRLAR